MCHRFAPLTMTELEEALVSWGRDGRAVFHRRSSKSEPRDAYPGHEVPIVEKTYDAGLQAAVMTWGFVRSNSDGAHGGPVFNARLDTALRQARSGSGLWAEAFAHGRCLVPARAFYELGHAPGGEAVGKHVYRFTVPGGGVFLMAGIAQDGHFAVVTTEPNPWVAPVHNRMPLVLLPGESQAWLAGDLAGLANRSRVRLEREEE